MRVTLYEQDEPDSQMEYEGTLRYRSASPALGIQWMALIDEGTFRRVATDKR
jgi:hypothetical protein